VLAFFKAHTNHVQLVQTEFRTALQLVEKFIIQYIATLSIVL